MGLNYGSVIQYGHEPEAGGLYERIDGYRRGAGSREDLARAAAGPGLAQVVEMSVGQRRQALEAPVAEHLPLAAQHGAGGGAGHLAQGRVHPGQKPDAGAGAAARKRLRGRSAASILNPAGGSALGGQARQLRPG